MFVACEIGQNVSNAFKEIDDEIDRFHWYLFPAEIQKMLPILLSVTQRPINIEVFGSIACDRENFKKVR